MTFDKCPTCGSAVWDNRAKINSGDFNKKSPHFACRDKECGWAWWPEKAPKGSRLSHDPVPAAPSNPKWTWFRLSKTYERCLLLAEMRLHESAERFGRKDMLSMADLLAATATLFIEACRSGIEEPKVRLPKEPEPQPVPFDEDAEDMPF